MTRVEGWGVEGLGWVELGDMYAQNWLDIGLGLGCWVVWGTKVHFYMHGELAQLECKQYEPQRGAETVSDHR